MGSFTAKKVQALIKDGTPGRYSDGNGLYLMIPKRGAPYWMHRYTFSGKRRELTLDRCVDLFLAEAREQAIEAQRAIRNGIDPVEERKREEQIAIHTVKGEKSLATRSTPSRATMPAWRATGLV